MTFYRLWLLNLIWLLPFLIFLFVVAGRKKDQALERFAENDLILRLCTPESRARRTVKSILLLLAAGLMMVGLAGPRWGERFQEVDKEDF